MTMAKKEKFAFPLLGIKEIVAGTYELGGAVEEKHILNPTWEVIWPLFESLATNVLNIPREEFQQPAFDVWCKLDHQELHQESLGCILSWRIINDLMHAAGIFDLTIRDLVKPDCSRTVRFLSGIINYAKFRQSREDAVADVQEEESLAETYMELEEEIEQTKREIAAIEAEREAEIPAVEALKAETDELLQEMSSLNKKQAVMQAEIQGLKKEHASFVDAVSGQNYMLQQANQEGSDLRGQIVESPEKLERVLEETKAALEATGVAVEEASKSLHHWEQKTESYTKAQKKAQKLPALLEVLQKECKAQKTALKEVKSLKAKLKADEEDDNAKQADLINLTSKGHHLQVLLDETRLFNLEKAKEEDRVLKDVKANYANFMMKKQVVKAAIAKTKAQVLPQMNQKAEVLRIKEEKIRMHEEKLADFQQKALEYYRLLNSRTGRIPRLSA